MKKIQLLILVMVATMMMTSCNSKIDKLRKEIDALQKELPIDMGTGQRLTSIIIDKESNEVVANILMDENLVNIALLKEHEDLVKKNFMYAIGIGGEFNDVFQECTDAGLGFAYQLVGSKTHATIKLSNDTDALSSLSNMKKKDIERAYVENNVKMCCLQLPTNLDNITKWYDMTFDGKTVTYEYELQEGEITMEYMKQMEESFGENIRQNVINNQEPSFKFFLDICKDINVGIRYRYKGNKSAETVSIDISPDEL